MGAMIRTTCNTCGQVDLHPEGIKLIRGAQVVTYKFICPKCGRTQHKMTDDTIVGLLLTAGVDWEKTQEEIRAETLPIFHPEDPDLSSPTLTYDDLSKLHEELEEL